MLDPSDESTEAREPAVERHGSGRRPQTPRPDLRSRPI